MTSDAAASRAFVSFIASLATGFDTKLLSEELLSIQPLEVANAGRQLRAVLDTAPALHFDEEPKQWGPDEIKSFNTNYFPALQQFGILALHNPELLYGTQDAGGRPLAHALVHLLQYPLLHDDSHFNAVPILLKPESSVMLAEIEFGGFVGCTAHLTGLWRKLSRSLTSPAGRQSLCV